MRTIDRNVSISSGAAVIGWNNATVSQGYLENSAVAIVTAGGGSAKWEDQGGTVGIAHTGSGGGFIPIPGATLVAPTYGSIAVNGSGNNWRKQ